MGPAHVNGPAAVETVLAFDFGGKRTGVAVGNTLTRTATPLRTIHEEESQKRLLTALAMVREWQPACLVVGRPCHPDGTAHAMTARAEKFARGLAGQTKLPVKLVDERYSSAVSDAAPADDVDGAAACLILQQYFDEVTAPAL
jgi:putative Holliday junction resolvase